MRRSEGVSEYRSEDWSEDAYLVPALYDGCYTQGDDRHS